MAPETEKLNSPGRGPAVRTSVGPVLAADVKDASLPGATGGCPLPHGCSQVHAAHTGADAAPALAVGSHGEESGNQCGTRAPPQPSLPSTAIKTPSGLQMQACKLFPFCYFKLGALIFCHSGRSEQQRGLEPLLHSEAGFPSRGQHAHPGGADHRAVTLMGGGRGVWWEQELLSSPPRPTESTQQLSPLQPGLPGGSRPALLSPFLQWPLEDNR